MIHGEAFCLMKYANKRRTILEILWNSRDGVTPFSIAAANLTGQVLIGDEERMLSHIDFQGDRNKPDHVPKDGERIFVDYSFDDFLVIIRRQQVQRYWNHPVYGMKDNPQYQSLGKDGTAKLLAMSSWKPGTPLVVTVGVDGSFEELMERQKLAQVVPDGWVDPHAGMAAQRDKHKI